MPLFVADSVGMAVRDGLSIYGKERLHHGDVVLCNHAAVQGQHLNNTVMYTPIFAGHGAQSLIGFFAINVHWIDIGGITPRSTDIFMEGLQLRSIKLWSKGEPIKEVYRIIENNTRFPKELMGDIAAQLAGCLLGRDLTSKRSPTSTASRLFSTPRSNASSTSAKPRRARRSALCRTASIQPGTFLDNDGESRRAAADQGQGHRRRRRDDGRFAARLPSRSRAASTRATTAAGRPCARVAFKYLIADEDAANEGTFRPLKLILPAGKLLSADPTAPMGNYSEPFPTVIDAVIKALEQALPARVTGAHFGTYSGVRFHGRRADGTLFDCHDSGHGGWGACATHDGAGPFRTMAHGDTRIIPFELQESMYPFRIEEFSLREDSAGAGKFRGGLGFRKRYRLLGDADLQAIFDRIKFPPWGVQGGKEGRSGRIVVDKKSGEEEIIYKEKAYPLEAGDKFTVETGGGGGYGPPNDRPRESVERDVMRGYVSAEAAARDYYGAG